MLGRQARFELGVDKRGWGFGYSTETRSHTLTHSVSQQTSQPLSEADKEEQHPAGGQHAPGGWGIIPLHRVGGAGGGRSIRVRGLCLSSGVPLHTHTHTHTNIHINIHLSAGSWSHYHTSIDLCS